MMIFNKITFLPIGACLGLFVGYLIGFTSIIIYNIPPMVGWWDFDIVGGITGFFIGTIVSIIIIIIIRRTKKPRDKEFKKKRNAIAIILSIILWVTLLIWIYLNLLGFISLLDLFGIIKLHFLTYPLIVSILLIIYVITIIFSAIKKMIKANEKKESFEPQES